MEDTMDRKKSKKKSVRIVAPFESDHAVSGGNLAKNHSQTSSGSSGSSSSSSSSNVSLGLSGGDLGTKKSDGKQAVGNGFVMERNGKGDDDKEVTPPPLEIVTVISEPGSEDGDFSSGEPSPPTPLTPSAELSPPERSALKKEDVTFVIRSSDPIGQDTAVYEFSKYRMPMPLNKSPEETTWESTMEEIERMIARKVAQTSTLLGRSSGRDKVAAMLQYLSMFWGAQPFVNISGIKDGPDAPWKKLEDSLSTGRKIFRLGKWIKEYERARMVLLAPDKHLIIGPPNKLLAFVTRLLAVTMNGFSFFYYVFDNMVWAAQANLINRAPADNEVRRIILSVSPKLPYEKLLELQEKHREALQIRDAANARVDKWKDMKNWSSLGRLVFALIHSILQIRCLRHELHRLVKRYEERIRISLGKSLKKEDEKFDDDDNNIPTSASRLERYDSLGSVMEKACRKFSPAQLEEEKQSRIKEIYTAIREQQQEVLAACCNLGILLSRLKFPFFKRLPLWVIGLLGTVSGYLGCLKNWPKFVPKPKKTSIAKLRSNSLDEKMRKST